MKVLILLSFLLPFTTYSQVDYLGTPETSKEKLNYLWHFYENDGLSPLDFHMMADQINPLKLNQVERILLAKMTNSFNAQQSQTDSFLIESLSREEGLQYLSVESALKGMIISLSRESRHKVLNLRKELKNIEAEKTLNRSDIMDIVFKAPDLAHYQNGKYKDSLRLFLFCRKSREYPCRFVVKDIFGDLVRNDDGSLWTLPALAKSARNIAYNKTNGQTPTGVHTINSVMPQANRQTAFGKYRRLILNWVPKSKNEYNSRLFLPASQQKLSWWKRASVARDAGRLHLRIHGTGRINKNPQSSYYPHMPTSGCVSVREGEYGSVAYGDQRVILDKLMEVSRLAPVYSNEPKLKGVLYVVNLNNEKRAVTAKDLAALGIQ